MAAVLALPALCAATRVTGIDVVSSLQRERVARLGPDEAFDRGTLDLAREMLVEPGSPYSEPTEAPPFTNEPEWAATLDALGGRVRSAHEALAVLRWDLGMSKAVPGQDVDVPARTPYRDRFVAANAMKADVDADIFWHMLDTTGYRHSTKAAYYAVGLQILRRQLADTRPERRAALGIDADVFTRVMQARHEGEIPEHDLRYLSALIQHRLLHWRPGALASTGLRDLPVAYRIARVAAAYHDREGYFTAPPCRADGSPAPGIAGTGAEGDARDLCFVAATDRAVHRWYVEEVHFQAKPRARSHHEQHSLLGGILAIAFPLLEVAALIEVVEAIVADELVATETLSAEEAAAASERADLLTCALPE